MEQLSPENLKRLIAIFEDSTEILNGLNQRSIEGIPAWDLIKSIGSFQYTEWARWLKCMGYAGNYEHYCYGERNWVKLIPEDNNHYAKYSCGVTANICRVRLSDVEVYQVNEETFIKEIVERLAFKFSKISGTYYSLSKYVWCLGQAVVGQGMSVPIYLVRGLRRAKKEIINTLKQNNAYGVVLSSSQTLSSLLRWPPGIQVQKLWDVLAGEPISIELNGVLASIPTIPKPEPLKKEKMVLDDNGQELCSYNCSTKVLKISGKPEWGVGG